MSYFNNLLTKYKKEMAMREKMCELQALLNNCVNDDEAILLEKELEGLIEKHNILTKDVREMFNYAKN